MWEETSLKLEQICDGCHRVHFPHWIIQLLASISNDLSTGCSEWLSPAVPPLNQMLWGIFLCCNGVNSHWVITPASYFFPPLISTLFKCLFVSPLRLRPSPPLTSQLLSSPCLSGAEGCWFWPRNACHLSSRRIQVPAWQPLTIGCPKQEVESMTRPAWPHRSLISNRPI